MAAGCSAGGFADEGDAVGVDAIVGGVITDIEHGVADIVDGRVEFREIAQQAVVDGEPGDARILNGTGGGDVHAAVSAYPSAAVDEDHRGKRTGEGEWRRRSRAACRRAGNTRRRAESGRLEPLRWRP